MRLTLLICVFSCLFGCSKPQYKQSPDVTNAKTAAYLQAEKYMKLSANSTSQKSITYRLHAIEHLLAADDIEQAEYSIHEDMGELKFDTNNTAHKNILLAKINLAKRNTLDAKQNLRNIWTPAKLPEDLLVKFYQTRAEVYSRSGNLLDAVQEHIYLSKHLKNETDIQKNSQDIWEILLQLTPNSLRAMPRDTAKAELNGWLDFASISKQYNASQEQLVQAMEDWQKRFPQHPAAGLGPIRIQQTSNLEENQLTDAQRIIAAPKKIALLLPLQGKHAKSAQAIRDGFLSAFYAQPEGSSKPTIQIYDTSNQDINQIHRDAIVQGADFIVGPLTKEEVDIISSSTYSDVPMLALNHTDKTAGSENILQFSLSPEFEAEVVARKAWLDGHRNAAIIIPKSTWGKRMLQSFKKTWQEYGGTIIQTVEISSQAGITNNIKHLLSIDASEQRAKKLRQEGFKIGFDARRREDIDMLFIATNSALARQVKPLLNFYYATNIPAYASSSIYTGKNQPNLDQDLNGIQFCDMPWLLDGTIDTRDAYTKVEALWQNDFDQYTRLYALGLDAYKIAQQIEQLTMMPNIGISGMTGMLTMNQQQAIERKLIWASFKKGLPQVHGEM